MQTKTMFNSDCDWLSKAKIGAFMHFLPSAETFDLVTKFDVDALILQLKISGARYFCFTLGQNSGYFNAPNPIYEELAGYQIGERCSRRNLPLEIAKACKLADIRFMLYLPCQPPNRDLKAVTALGFPEKEINTDRMITDIGSRNWAKVISYWSELFGDLVSGWWFDGGYQWIGFRDEHSVLYAEAAKKGNPHSIITCNPGVCFQRSTIGEDYIAGEINNPFEITIPERWIDGSQAHILTFLGNRWGQRNCRFSTAEWCNWLKPTFASGCAVTIDMGPNYDMNSGSAIGTFSDEQIQQFTEMVKTAN